MDRQIDKDRKGKGNGQIYSSETDKDYDRQK